MSQPTKEQDLIRNLQEELHRTKAQLRLHQKAQKVASNAAQQSRESSMGSGTRRRDRGIRGGSSGSGDNSRNGSGKVCQCHRCLRFRANANPSVHNEDINVRSSLERTPAAAAAVVTPPSSTILHPPLPSVPAAQLSFSPSPYPLPSPPPTLPSTAVPSPSRTAAGDRKTFSSSWGSHSTSPSASFEDTPRQTSREGSSVALQGYFNAEASNVEKQHASALQQFTQGQCSAAAPTPAVPRRNSSPSNSCSSPSYSGAYCKKCVSPLCESCSSCCSSSASSMSSSMTVATTASTAAPSRSKCSVPQQELSSVSSLLGHPQKRWSPNSFPNSAPFPPPPPQQSSHLRSPSTQTRVGGVALPPSVAALHNSAHNPWQSSQAGIPGMDSLTNQKQRCNPPPHSPHHPLPSSTSGFAASHRNLPSPSLSTSSSCSSVPSYGSASVSCPSTVWSTLPPSSPAPRLSHETVVSAEGISPPSSASTRAPTPSKGGINGNQETPTAYQGKSSRFVSIPPRSMRQQENKKGSGRGGVSPPRVHGATAPVTSSPSGTERRTSSRGSCGAPGQFFSPCCGCHSQHHSHSPQHNITVGERGGGGCCGGTGGSKSPRKVEKTRLVEEVHTPRRGQPHPCPHCSHSTSPSPKAGSCRHDAGTQVPGSFCNYLGPPMYSPSSTSLPSHTQWQEQIGSKNLHGKRHSNPCSCQVQCKAHMHNSTGCLSDSEGEMTWSQSCSVCKDTDCGASCGSHSLDSHGHPICGQAVERRRIKGEENAMSNALQHHHHHPPSRRLSRNRSFPCPSTFPSEKSSLPPLSTPSPKVATRKGSNASVSPLPLLSCSPSIPHINPSGTPRAGEAPASSLSDCPFSPTLMDQAHQQHLRNAKRALAMAHEELLQAREKRMKMAEQMQQGK